MTTEKIAKYMAKRKLTEKRFERLCGIGNGCIGKWRMGKSNPSIKTLEKIAKATNTSIKSWL